MSAAAALQGMDHLDSFCVCLSIASAAWRRQVIEECGCGLGSGRRLMQNQRLLIRQLDLSVAWSESSSNVRIGWVAEGRRSGGGRRGRRELNRIGYLQLGRRDERWWVG